jgi:DNA-binding transcriptional LysR family regulator
LQPSVVSHHVRRLEARLGVPLMYRTTRRLSLTAEGEHLFAAAQQMWEAAERGLDELTARDEGPSGELRMTIPGFLDQTTFLDGLAEFLLARPRVRIRLVSSDERRDLVSDGIDLAVRMGGLADSGLRTRRVATLHRALVASPGYVALRSPAVALEDLVDWDLLQLESRAPELGLARTEEEPVQTVRLRPRVVCTSSAALLALAVAGLGVASLPRVLVRAALRDGSLVEVLPGWRLEALGVYLVWPDGARRRVLTGQLVEFLAPRLGRAFVDAQG